jgi:type I restriction-modification system DNA methylase subunit
MANIDLLQVAYDTLGYGKAEGDSLLSPCLKPANLSADSWMQKGDWLAAAFRVNADKVYFINGNPVVLFSRVPSEGLKEIREACSRAWSMARPRILFLCTPTELQVYDLGDKPKHNKDGSASVTPLEVAKTSKEVLEKLKRYNRDSLDSGTLFSEEKHFGTPGERADSAIINDLREVRTELIISGLSGDKVKYVHSLIGRSIFIRYLEERRVLTKSYFENIATQNKTWSKLLEEPKNKYGVEIGSHKPMYPRVLQSKLFTYALFKKLTEDFNGDVFPDIQEEKNVVDQKHLDLLQDLLYGDTGAQRSLFFQAYRFDIIPIELISSIYEMFYSISESRSKQGAYYTAPSLAEFVVSTVLDQETLNRNPKILDPSCGSGIFLVESFRRIVRYRVTKNKRRLRFDELRKILKDQIYGVDLNEDAVRIAAFSLYLSLLHYLEPQEIREEIVSNKRLPHLVSTPERKCNLVSENAFSDFESQIENCPKDGFDVILGNPPWSSEDDSALRVTQTNWTNTRQLPVGGFERSQAFLWRSLSLLNQKGKAGLLVSSGVLLKRHKKSISFRELFFKKAQIDSIYNFSTVRKVFFSGGNSPFISVFFGKEKKEKTVVRLWSAKKTAFVEGLQAVVLNKNDLNFLKTPESFCDSEYWKTHFWGGSKDWVLLQSLLNQGQLINHIRNKAQGFKFAQKNNPPEWLGKYKVLPTKCLYRYGKISSDYFDLPVIDHVERRGVEEVYHGKRLLVRRGIPANGPNQGRIVARYSKDPFAFTHSINGLKLINDSDCDYCLITAILWSSLASYYFFLTTSDWGTWHDAINLNELLTLPVPDTVDCKVLSKIKKIVHQLQNSTDEVHASFLQDKTNELKKLEFELDELVFDAFMLTDSERGRIKDFVNHAIPLYYKGKEEKAINGIDKKSTQLQLYIKTFMDYWCHSMGQDGSVNVHFVQSEKDQNLLALIIESKDAKIQSDLVWKSLMSSLQDILNHDISRNIMLERFAQYTFKDWAVIIKPNHKRLWTQTAAREDAEGLVVEYIREPK